MKLYTPTRSASQFAVIAIYEEIQSERIVRRGEIWNGELRGRKSGTFQWLVFTSRRIFEIQYHRSTLKLSVCGKFDRGICVAFGLLFKLSIEDKY